MTDSLREQFPNGSEDFFQVNEASSPEMPDNSQAPVMPVAEQPVPIDGGKGQGRQNQAKRSRGGNKYGAVRTWSEACQRTFDSRAEARRGEELHFMALAGDIADLKYQIPFVLCEKPRINVTLDFSYIDEERVYEDVKGVLTRDSRTKYAWLKEKHGIDVKLIK